MFNADVPRGSEMSMNIIDKRKAGILILFLFFVSPCANALILNSYTANFSDGSRLVIDLKGHDYGQGEHYAPPNAWVEADDPSDYPYIEPFDTFYYSSVFQRQIAPWIPFGKITSGNFGDGLYFEVDKFNGVDMIDLSYIFMAPDWTLSDNGVNLFYEDYDAEFMGGYFDISITPYPVQGPAVLMLLLLGVISLVLGRYRGMKFLNAVYR